MTISKLKAGAVLAAVAVGFSWAALAADPKPITPPAAKADPPKADAKPADAPKPQPVATVNGEEVSRAEFGEYLIRKYGAQEIELFVNKRVIENAAADKDIRIPADDVVKAFDADTKALGMSREDFVKNVLPKYGKTENEWWADVLTPRLILEKLNGKVEVTDDELKKLFERKYGEQRKVQLIVWDKTVAKETVQKEYTRAKGSVAQFDSVAANQSNTALSACRGFVRPFGRPATVSGDQKAEEAAFGLKLQDVSELLETDKSWVAVMLVEILPSRTEKKFDDEKASLREEAVREKVLAEIPKLFEKLKAEAKPVYHIKPEPKAVLLPLPVKK